MGDHRTINDLLRLKAEGEILMGILVDAQKRTSRRNRRIAKILGRLKRCSLQGTPQSPQKQVPPIAPPIAPLLLSRRVDWSRLRQGLTSGKVSFGQIARGIGKGTRQSGQVSRIVKGERRQGPTAAAVMQWALDNGYKLPQHKSKHAAPQSRKSS